MVHHLPWHPVLGWATDEQASVPDCTPRDSALTLHSATAKSAKTSRDMTLGKMGTMCTDLLPESRAKGDKMFGAYYNCISIAGSCNPDHASTST